MPDAPRLLLYRTVTSPAPLQAGSPDDPAANSIDVIVSSPDGQNVYCNKIDIAVPVGEPQDAGAYFTEAPQSSTDNDKWQIASVELVSGRELGLASDTNYHHVIFQPRQGGPAQFRHIDQPMTLTITGKLAADATGSLLTCLVTETSSTTDGHYTRKDPLMLTLPTAEPPFYLHNLLAATPNEPTIPRTKFNAGDEISLTWESNGDSFHLYGGDGTVLHEGPETTWTVPAGAIANDTTFTLKASKKNSTGFGTVDRYATITITITNPTLSELTVNGSLGVYGKLTANDGLSVSNTLTTDVLEAGAATVTRSCQIDGDCDVSGDLTSEGLFVNGDTSMRGRLQVNEGVTLDDTLVVVGRLTASSDCDVNGGLSANQDFSVSYGGTEKITTVGKSGLWVEGDFSVSDGGTEKITTYGYNGLYVDGDLTVNGRIND
ncbi:hypothetical protein GCM10022224_058780 [Nonomuraea antimicrobica]|uniref:Uncharacterized protein n=1 Tax=Nonomuraea antimicrobica TaxID=561173 RepID=A0ABP7CBA7_9ACTN